MKKKHVTDYSLVRCPCCGVPWAEHNETDICARYRPTNVAPEWVADAVARHEATDAGKPEATVPGSPAGPMVRALLRAVGIRNEHAVEGLAMLRAIGLRNGHAVEIPKGEDGS